MGVEIALMSILALGGAGIYLGLKTLENYSPGRKKVQKDLQQLKDEIKSLVADLVPLNQEEMGQLSFNLASRSSRKGVVKTAKGVFTTVYHEPLVAWVYRRYVSSKENALIYAKTTKYEIIYRTKRNMTEVVVNDKLIGTIDIKGVLRVNGGKKPVASITSPQDNAYLPIVINGKEMGGVTNIERSDQANPRAFQLLHAMKEDEELLFLILALREMVKVSI